MTRRMHEAAMTPEQRKRAIVSAAVLALLALGIYLTVMLKVFVAR